MDRASATARNRLLLELSRSRRSSSPRDEDFATAGSFDISHNDVIHSTAQLGRDDIQQGFMYKRTSYLGDQSTEGSANMSIEVGRGAKKSLDDRREDLSSNAFFNLGDDSMYEVTTTPPVKPKAAAWKPEGGSRRDISTRRPPEAIKSNDAVRRSKSGTINRTLAEALGRAPAPDDTVLPADLPTATMAQRNTRFTRFRQTSAPEKSRTTVPLRSVSANNPTVQSTTANSFQLPDLPNISELIAGTRNDGTAVFGRTAKSNSRFASAAYSKALRPEHASIERVPIPIEEHALYTSLQLLKDKVAELEADKSSAQQRAERYEDDIANLRAQLSLAQRRPDSALGSDEEDRSQQKLQRDNSRLQGSVKSLQERLSRSEQRVGVSSITVDRVVQEREKLITQIGLAYHENEKLQAENETLCERNNKLEEENQALQEVNGRLRGQNTDLQQGQAQQSKPIPHKKRSTKTRSESLQATGSYRHTAERERSTLAPRRGPAEPVQIDDFAERIAREVQTHRDRANRNLNASRSYSRSRSQGRRHTLDAAVAAATDGYDFDTTEIEYTEKTREPTLTKRSTKRDNTAEITILSDFAADDCAQLRKKIEKEYRANRANRRDTAESQGALDEDTRNSMPRKPSLRDIRREVVEQLSKATKSVRVQSPHNSDLPIPSHSGGNDVDVSIVSNISRPRRRPASADGMTSAFIVPDITLHANRSLPDLGGKGCREHHAEGCTVCRRADESVTPIPRPIPVSERSLPEDPDITSATVRPAQDPPLALATVIKELEDEITHLKSQLKDIETRFHQHVPALSKRKRQMLTSRGDSVKAEINRRMDQVYALYDVLEGQKQSVTLGVEPTEMTPEAIEETLMSIGLDPVQLSGRVGRSAPMPGLDDISSVHSDDLPWEGLSDLDDGDEEEEGEFGEDWK